MMQQACSMQNRSPYRDDQVTPFIEVAVALPVHRCFTYRVPEAMYHAVGVGMRVLVPFGHRRLTGYVLGFTPQAPKAAVVKDILDVLDDKPLFHPGMVPFFQWVSKYYLYPLGEVIQTALPGGLTVMELGLFRLSDDGRTLLQEGHFDDMTRRLFEAMDDKACNFSLLSRKSEGALSRAKLNTWVAKGWVVRQFTLNRGRTRPKTRRFVNLVPLKRDVRISKQRKIILDALQTHGALSIAELKRSIPTAANLVRAMVKDHQVIVEERVVYRDPFGAPIAPDHPPDLSTEQRDAVQKMGQALGRGFQTFLLSGVTGSGKTEVYLHLAAQALQQQMAVLVLVPEIALISQMERAFRARFGEQIALLHSGLSNGERYDQWRRIIRGDIPIAIGARSAIFAPFDRLGLIIVDEEHDDSYKQEGSLRYHARDLAVVRAQMDRSIAVLGSATPSVQTAFNVDLGKYQQLFLHQRIDHRSLPQIVVQDLSQVKEEQGLRRFITPQLIDAMTDCLSRNEQVLLFLNRRGFANMLVCDRCGAPVRCDRCDISLTYHKGMNAYKCHHCGFSRSAAGCRCNRCGSGRIKRMGLGTEKVESKVQSLFPQARVARMDRDTTRRKGATVRILKSLKERRIDILIGTQMVAKGHDYPHITLVGIVCADLSLNMPDFRAGERTFQLLAQVAGRAGRGTSPGKVILQTYNPDHFSIQAARNQDYYAFYRQEIEFRKSLAYPPFTRMVQVRVQGKDKAGTARYVKQLGRLCRKLQQSNAIFKKMELLGPVEAPLARIADHHRWQLLIKCPDVKPLHGFVRELLYGNHQAIRKKKEILVAVDVDPCFLM
jgi:primosomal protein N' (replication factor Y)